MEQTKLKYTLAKVFLLVFAVFIAEMVSQYRSCNPQPIQHKQFIIGDYQAGEIPDSVVTDSNDNTTYYFKPIN